MSDPGCLAHRNQELQEQIAELKRREATLRKLASAVEHSPISVMITDRSGTIEYVNPKFCQVTGYLPEEVLGENPRILKGGAQQPEFYRELWQTILSGQEWHGEFLRLTSSRESCSRPVPPRSPLVGSRAGSGFPSGSACIPMTVTRPICSSPARIRPCMKRKGRERTPSGTVRRTEYLCDEERYG